MQPLTRRSVRVRSHLIAINAVSSGSRANPRSHVVIQRGRPKSIRAVVKISRLYVIRTEIRNLREADLPHLFSQFGGVEKAGLWFTASFAAGNTTASIFCVSSSTKSFGTVYSKMISVPGASAATARNVPKIASVERYMVTPSHEKRPGQSVR
jgi:hypothetical protein